MVGIFDQDYLKRMLRTFASANDIELIISSSPKFNKTVFSFYLDKLTVCPIEIFWSEVEDDINELFKVIIKKVMDEMRKHKEKK